MLVILGIIDWKTILTSRTYFIRKLIPFTNYKTQVNLAWAKIFNVPQRKKPIYGCDSAWV